MASQDLPAQALLQQMRAQPRTGEYLELLGKRASAQWAQGEHDDLSSAVVSVVKEAHLSPEQVRRVIEFANTSAFLDEFHKEGAAHKVIDFQGGPADPDTVLQDLNDGGGGSLFDSGLGDYNSPPESFKAASAEEEGLLKEAFGGAPEDRIPFADPLSEAVELYEKLAGAAEHTHAQVSDFEVLFGDLGEAVYQEVKRASLDSGVSLGQVLQAWQTVTPDADLIKTAFELLAPRLLRDEVFAEAGEMAASLDKTASGVLNPAHPLVTCFADFCDCVTKLAEARRTHEELVVHQKRLGQYIKEASVVGKITGATRAAANASRPFLNEVLGPTGGMIAAKGIQYSPHAAALVGAHEANMHLENSPSIPAQGYRRAKNLLLRNIPGTNANIQHIMGIQYGQPQ